MHVFVAFETLRVKKTEDKNRNPSVFKSSSNVSGTSHNRVEDVNSRDLETDLHEPAFLIREEGPSLGLAIIPTVSCLLPSS